MLSAYPSWLLFRVREVCLSWLSFHRNRIRLYPVWIPFRRRLCFWHSLGTPFRKSSFHSDYWKTYGCCIRLRLTVLSCRPVWFSSFISFRFDCLKICFLFPSFWTEGWIFNFLRHKEDEAAGIISQIRIENRLCSSLFSSSEWNAVWHWYVSSYIRRRKENGSPIGKRISIH